MHDQVSEGPFHLYSDIILESELAATARTSHSTRVSVFCLLCTAEYHWPASREHLALLLGKGSLLSSEKCFSQDFSLCTR